MNLMARINKLEKQTSPPAGPKRVFTVAGGSRHTDADLTSFLASHGIERQDTDRVIFIRGMEWPDGRQEYADLPLTWAGPTPKEARAA